MIDSILHGLGQPEYVHVLTNPLPVYSLAMGLIGLFVAICQRSRPAMIAALVVVLVSTAAAWPVYQYGERAYDGILSMSDEAGRAWLAAHKARAENLIWFFYAVAALSAIALFLPIKSPRSSLGLALAVLVLGMISLGVGGYIAYAGGKIRHREFRLEPPPKAMAPAAQSFPEAASSWSRNAASKCAKPCMMPASPSPLATPFLFQRSSWSLACFCSWAPRLRSPVSCSVA